MASKIESTLDKAKSYVSKKVAEKKSILLIILMLVLSLGMFLIIFAEDFRNRPNQIYKFDFKFNLGMVFLILLLLGSIL